LKVGSTGCPETSARNYSYSLRNNPEERISQFLYVCAHRTSRLTDDFTLPIKPHNIYFCCDAVDWTRHVHSYGLS